MQQSPSAPTSFGWVARSKKAKRDPNLVAFKKRYEVSYFARKHRISAAEAREILQRAGRSREEADEAGKAGKKRGEGM